MSRAHALELVLDAPDDRSVRERWRDLEQSGLASLARHQGATHRPHVTVATSKLEPSEAVLELARAVWSPLLPAVVGRAGLVLLGRRSLTVAELLSPSTALRGAREQVAAAWEGSDTRDWVPHVSLATRLTQEEVGRAISVLTRDRADPRATQDGPQGSAVRVVRGLRWWNPELGSVSHVAGVVS